MCHNAANPKSVYLQISLQGEVEGTQDLLMRWVYLWMVCVSSVELVCKARITYSLIMFF